MHWNVCWERGHALECVLGTRPCTGMCAGNEDKHWNVVRLSLLLVKEEVDDIVLSLGMVEEHKQAPVDQPRPLLQAHQVWSAQL